MQKVRRRDKQRGRSRDKQTVKDVACKTQRVRHAESETGREQVVTR